MRNANQLHVYTIFVTQIYNTTIISVTSVLHYAVFAADTDYISRNTTVTFNTTLSFECVIIDIVDDNDAEEQETFLISFSSSDPAVRLENFTAVVYIINNDCMFCTSIA